MPSSAPTASGKHDFDFLVGKWTIHNRRLEERLAGCTRWIEFEAEHEAWTILDGFGSFDRLITTWDGKFFEGVSLRIFDPKTGDWSIYWVDSWLLELQEPVVGRFEDGRGVFFTKIQFEGREVRVRFVWSEIQADSARWEQAYSDDGGETWETNWVMEFTRRA